ncbi:XRE family transcriptional regulator [Beijerinckia sp. L45]|uniref:XRE family transcriptional regulator n=1 Tax=Beijerinckia sp. L45 TaxID=1641855 RepID=UPI00131DF952|nr:XRE family transcriptional regulator [Beijerinckia sp. L45]
MTDTEITADQCRIGRAAVGWTEDDLAAAAGVAVGIITDLENGLAADAAASSRILAALADVGVSFFSAPDGSARMRARTLDGIIEAPVAMTQRR